MRNADTKLIDTTHIEARFVFSQKIDNTQTIIDDEGNKLAFHRCSNGNNIVFTKDAEGIDVAIEHCIDGSKVYHLSQDSKGLPAMHEFRPDGAELMYLLDTENRLEKLVETKSNGDKVSTWFYANEIIVQEQRQTDGSLFKIINDNGEALIWLHADGSVEAYGNETLVERLKSVFIVYLDGAEF